MMFKESIIRAAGDIVKRLKFLCGKAVDAAHATVSVECYIVSCGDSAASSHREVRTWLRMKW